MRFGSPQAVELAARVAGASRSVEPIERVTGNLRRYVWIGEPLRHRITFAVAVDGIGGITAEMFTPLGITGDAERLDIWAPLGFVDMHWAANPPDYLRDGYSQPECLVTGGQCWCDGTGLQAEKTVELFLSGGHEAVWSWLGEEWLPRLTEEADQ